MTGPEDETVPVVMRDDTRVEFMSCDLNPGAETQLGFSPGETLQSPTMFASVDPKDAAVAVIVLVDEPPFRISIPVAQLRYGRKVAGEVSRARPLAVEVRNLDERAVRIGLSLVTGEDGKGKVPEEEIP